MEIIIIPIVSVMIVVFVDWLFGLSKMKKTHPKAATKARLTVPTSSDGVISNVATDIVAIGAAEMLFDHLDHELDDASDYRDNYDTSDFSCDDEYSNMDFDDYIL